MSQPDRHKWFSKKHMKQRKRDKDIPADECGPVQRLKVVLEHYHSFIEHNHLHNHGIGMYAYLSRTLRNYTTVKLLDDYHYILSRFYNQLSVIHQILTENLADIDISKSLIFKRNHRNRQHCALDNDRRCEWYGGYNACEEVSVQKLLDKIYCHLILSFDAGYILTQQEILQIATQQIEESKEIYYGDESQDASKDNAVDSALQIIVNITKQKSKTLYKVRGRDRMKYNKFVSHVVPEPDEEEDEQKSHTRSDHRYEVEFGYQFKYWRSYKEHAWYIAPKYENLKSEMIRNKTCSLSFKQFEDDIKNAITYISTKRGKKLKCRYQEQNFNQPTREQIRIREHAPMTIDHMIALMIFCNYDVLRKHIVSVYSKSDAHEKDAELRSRHTEFANLCRLLYEAVRLYGTDIGKHGGFNMTFYHCFNQQIYFDEFHCYFGYPASTTTSLSVITTHSPFADSGYYKHNGLVVQLKKDVEYVGDQHYFDCAWFSDFGSESEKLFLNIMLSFKSILYPALYHNYAQYMNAFTALQSMVIGAELSQNILTPLIPKILEQMIKNQLQLIPEYILALYQSFRETIDNIQINVWLMIIDSYELMDEVVSASDSEDGYGDQQQHERAPNDGNQYGYLKLHSLFIANDGWIYVDRLALLLPETTHIELFNGNVQTAQILPCITLDESTMNNLLNVLEELSRKTKLNKISFYYPDEQLLTIESILKHFTRWFQQIQWDLRFVVSKAPFLPDKCEAVRTLIVFKQHANKD